jgi:hypothetical protein
MGLQHVGPEDPAEIFHQMMEVMGFVEAKRLAVHLDHPDQARADLDPCGILQQVITQRNDTGLLPFCEEILQAAVILEPEGDGRQLEHLGVVVKLTGLPGIRILGIGMKHKSTCRLSKSQQHFNANKAM